MADRLFVYLIVLSSKCVKLRLVVIRSHTHTMQSDCRLTAGFILWFLGMFAAIIIMWTRPTTTRIDTPVTWNGVQVSDTPWNTLLTLMLTLITYGVAAIIDTEHKDRFSPARSCVYVLASMMRHWHTSLVVGFMDLGYVASAIIIGLVYGALSYFAESRNGIYASLYEQKVDQYNRVANDNSDPIALPAPSADDIPIQRPSLPRQVDEAATTMSPPPTEIGSPTLGDPHQHTGTFSDVELHPMPSPPPPSPLHLTADNSSAAARVIVAPDDLSTSSAADGSIPTNQIKDITDTSCISTYSFLLLVVMTMYTALTVSQITYMPVDPTWPIAGYFCMGVVELLVWLDTVNIVTGYGASYDALRLITGFGTCSTFLAYYLLSNRS